jgi:integrase
MMSGGNILTLQKLLGHSSVAVTMKYAHLAPDFMRDEIARLRFERPSARVADLTAARSVAAG